MIKVLLALILVIVSNTSSARWLVDLDGYASISHNEVREINPALDKLDGYALGSTVGYQTDNPMALVGSFMYNFSYTQLEYGFAGLVYDNASVTYGRQPMAYDMFADGDFSYGLGSILLGKQIGGGMQDNVLKLYYDSEILSVGVSRVSKHGKVESSRSMGVRYKVYENIHIAYAGVSTVGSSHMLKNGFGVVTADMFSLTYRADGIALALTRENVAWNSVESQATYISGRYRIMENVTVSASLGHREFQLGTDMTATVGARYRWWPGFILSAEHVFKYGVNDTDETEFRLRYEF